MNVKTDTSDDVTQVDVKCDRKTRVKLKNPRHAANAASVEKAADTSSAESEEDMEKEPDPRKVHDLNADDFFKLGRCRI